MVCLADSEVLDGHVAKFSPMSWANKKLKRVCRSSLACEVQAGAEALEELEVLRLLYAEAVEGGLKLTDPKSHFRGGPPAVLVTDCKSMYDALSSSASSLLGLSDKRSAVEALAMKEAMEDANCEQRWVHSQAQLGDSLTKESLEASRLMMTFLKEGKWRIVHDPNFESARKRAKAGLKILEADGDQEMQQQPT